MKQLLTRRHKCRYEVSEEKRMRKNGYVPISILILTIAILSISGICTGQRVVSVPAAFCPSGLMGDTKAIGFTDGWTINLIREIAVSK